MAIPDPTFDQVALADLRAKGVTCRSCEHWVYVGKGGHGIDGACEINRPSFPRVCRLYEYCPGSDQDIDHERNHDPDHDRNYHHDRHDEDKAR